MPRTLITILKKRLGTGQIVKNKRNATDRYRRSNIINKNKK